ncbi:MAG TPA: citrate synthase/methylcitrate synthase [Acidimicrobiia bacterium]|nr:citrate synthase/methylcitrate synthase [Acidimicrobiia bacterium]
MTEFKPGLEGVVAAETSLSSVDGQRGELIIAGFPLEELAANASFEEVCYLLWYGQLPGPEELNEFRTSMASYRALPAATYALLAEAAKDQVTPMDALRMASATFDLDLAHGDDLAKAKAITARVPPTVATYWRLYNHQEPIEPRFDLGRSANYLYMINGEEPGPETVRGLETYLNTVSDHGLNASTFAARVIISTNSDMVSAITGAIGALKGPLHGGAPGPALNMVFEIGAAERAEAHIRALLDRGERLMGFGHRVYKVRDPRADVLAHAAERMYQAEGDMALYELSKEVEATALRLLDEYKPDRNLRTNVEFFTALLLHGIGLETPLFTPTFAAGRVAGWIGHCFEQQRTGRLIRPESVYVGPRDQRWVPLAER